MIRINSKVKLLFLNYLQVGWRRGAKLWSCGGATSFNTLLHNHMCQKKQHKSDATDRKPEKEKRNEYKGKGIERKGFTLQNRVENCNK